jgi:hypothetical protein
MASTVGILRQRSSGQTPLQRRLVESGAMMARGALGGGRKCVAETSTSMDLGVNHFVLLGELSIDLQVLSRRCSRRH